MRKIIKAIIVYLLYGIHLASLIYFGMTTSYRLAESSYCITISIAIILLGAVVYLSAYLKLGVKNSSGTSYNGLVSSGIYKFIRNPQILGWMIILSGISLYLNSLISLVLSIVFWMLYKMLLQPIEEKNLTKKYGENYLKYKNKTLSGI